MNPWNDSEGFAREALKVESVGEAVMLTLLWWRRAGWTVVTQKPIEQYRIDLFVPEAGVAIEVDSLAGHGTNAAMEKDARKRNLVVARGWAPLTFSAQQATFSPHEVLPDILAAIGARLAPLQRPVPPPAEGRGSSPQDPKEMARYGRDLIASLRDGHDDPGLVLSPTHRALADRTPRELLGIELLGLAIQHPVLLQDDAIAEAMANIDGPVALAASRLREACSDGRIDQGAFLGLIPAILRPVAAERLAGSAGDFVAVQRQANDLVVRLRGAA